MPVKATLVYDVGMHKGEDTEFYLRKGFDVVGFEANPKLISYCKSRFASEIASRRLRIVDGAVGPRSAGDSLTFYVNKTTSVWGTADADWARRNEKSAAPSEKIEVNRVDIVDAFQDFGIPYYLKVDIEGADSLVLDALEQVEDRPKYVSIEAETVHVDQFRKDLNQLRILGYRRFMAVQQASIPGSQITTKTLSGDVLVFTFGPDASGAFGEDLAGHWRDYDKLVEECEYIVKLQKLFGLDSVIRRIKGGWRIINLLQIFQGSPLPGWHDIHTSLQ